MSYLFLRTILWHVISENKGCIMAWNVKDRLFVLCFDVVIDLVGFWHVF
jgi:hypothetical protein